MKKRIWILYLLLIIGSVSWSQPLPNDGRGPGNPGGDPIGNDHLGGGAPVDEFVLGIIILALIYGAIKWYLNPNKFTLNRSTENSC